MKPLPASRSIGLPLLVFQDPSSQRLRRWLERLAPTDMPLLLRGETGSGKEVIARQVHALSGRTGPFVALHCGAMGSALRDPASEFGRDWLDVAPGGTLLLDDIDELPMPLQHRLLAQMRLRCVTGTRARVVATIHATPTQAVARQSLSAELGQFLQAGTIELPPLRARSADILPLAQHFIARHGAGLLPLPELSLATRELLLRHNWPGNVRELENTIRTALLNCRQGSIQPDDIQLRPLRIQGDACAMQTLHEALDAVLRAQGQDLFERVEAMLVSVAYDHAGRNQARAAKLLGITRTALRTQLKRHGLVASSDAPSALPQPATSSA